MPEAVIVSAVRTAVGKAPKGTLRATRPDDLGAFAIQGALQRVANLEKKEIDDVIIGCAMPEAEQGMNVARVCSLRAGLPIEAAAMTINRYCASGLQSIALAAERIRGGGADVIVAGGTESMSLVPMGGNKISINPWLMEHYPNSYLSMGLTAERVARHYGITREEADQFALASHQKALAAQAAGRFADEIVPVPVVFAAPNGGPKLQTTEIDFKADEGPRGDTSLEALAKLKPVFDKVHGSVTAGNSSPLTDGAAALLVMREDRAKALGLQPLGALRAFAYAATDPGDQLLQGPAYAAPLALDRAGMTLRDIDLVEMHEAFAAQVASNLQAFASPEFARKIGRSAPLGEVDPDRLNVHGGSIALGHPFGATGARIVMQALDALARRDKRTALCTVCAAGGLGAAIVLERI